jgi:uncharacterized protein (DUF1501 family)
VQITIRETTVVSGCDDGQYAESAPSAAGATVTGRREFLKRAAILGAAGVVMLSPYAWAARAAKGDSSRKRLVVVFLRGAVDGLNVVVPYDEPRYYEERPTIAIPRAGGEGGVIKLDGFFGLNPALAALKPHWRDGTLAFVHACGSPDPTRSHFEAQEYMESGTPGVISTGDGWMNRVLAVMPGKHGPTEALSLGPVVPRILSGRMPVANLALGRGAARPMPLDRPIVEAAFDRLYPGNGPLGHAYREGRIARRKLLAELEKDMREADHGAPSPAGFPGDTARLARLIAGDPTIRLAFMTLGGWDTHVNEGSSRGQLANHLKPLGEGLSSFATALGSHYQDTVVVVISEFGRTVRQNGNGGTDHGHGNVMWVMGGPVRGGKVYGAWPGLSNQHLYQDRDLAITTDFREPISDVLEKHLGLGRSQVGRVFPDCPKPSSHTASLLRI